MLRNYNRTKPAQIQTVLCPSLMLRNYYRTKAAYIPFYSKHFLNVQYLLLKIKGTVSREKSQFFVIFSCDTVPLRPVNNMSVIRKNN